VAPDQFFGLKANEQLRSLVITSMAIVKRWLTGVLRSCSLLIPASGIGGKPVGAVSLPKHGGAITVPTSQRGLPALPWTYVVANAC
jgi:hypothetical protein